MNGWKKLAPALAGAALLVGCTEAETSPADGSESAAPVAMWELSTTSTEARRAVEAGTAIMDMNGLLNNRPFTEEANDEFKRAVTEDPSFAYAYLMAAATAPSFDEYRANLARAAELAEGASEAERLQIQIEEQRFDGDLDGATETARELIALDESNPRSWVILADLQSAGGMEEEARASAKKAVEVEPDFTHGHLWLANSYLLFQPIDFDAAEAYVQRALELAPNESAPHDLQGDLDRAYGRFDEAAAAYTRASELDPTDAGVLLQRGHVHTFAGNWDQARADYDASSERARGNTRAVPLLYRALVSAFAGDYEASVAEFADLDGRLEHIGVTDPDGFRIDLLYYKDVIAIGSGQLDVARQDLERLSALLRQRAEQVGTDEFRRRREADIAAVEGWIAVEDGDWATARARAATIRELLAEERDPTKDRPVHMLLGLAALGEGHYDEAVEHLEQTDPNNEYTHYQRAVALEKAGRTEEAQAIYQAIATNNFNTPELSLVRRDAIAKAHR